MNFRQSLLNAAGPFLRLASDIRSPVNGRQINEGDVVAIKKILQPGDVFLSTKNGEFTNLLQKGRYKHAAIYTPIEGLYTYLAVVESVDPKVRLVGLYEFLLHKDDVVVLRCNRMSGEERLDAAVEALNFRGASYDYQFYMPDDFHSQNRAHYCSELVFLAHKIASPDWDFPVKTVWGVKTVSPMDLYNSLHFDVIWRKK